MSAPASGEASFCEIIGCAGEGTHTRWVFTDDDGRRQIQVCWKHAEGELDPAQIQASS